jgi:hypothetical protein
MAWACLSSSSAFRPCLAFRPRLAFRRGPAFRPRLAWSGVPAWSGVAWPSGLVWPSDVVRRSGLVWPSGVVRRSRLRWPSGLSRRWGDSASTRSAAGSGGWSQCGRPAGAGAVRAVRAGRRRAVVPGLGVLPGPHPPGRACPGSARPAGRAERRRPLHLHVADPAAVAGLRVRDQLLGSLAGGAAGTLLGLHPALWIAAGGGTLGFLCLLPSPMPRFRLAEPGRL